jgi:hypothetical protein
MLRNVSTSATTPSVTARRALTRATSNPRDDVFHRLLEARGPVLPEERKRVTREIYR